MKRLALFLLVSATILTLVSASEAGTVQVFSKAHPDALPDSGSSLSFGTSISSDGRYVVFMSYSADLVPGQIDTNRGVDVFLWDRLDGTTTLVSRSSSSAATTGNAPSADPVISADGLYVAFVSVATDLVPNQTDTNGTSDLFLFDRITETTVLISHAAGLPNTTANGYSDRPSIAAGGARIVFQSEATDLVAGLTDTNERADVFLYEAFADLRVVSHESGNPGRTGDGASFAAKLSVDGSRVAFVSDAGNLSPGQTDINGRFDVFLYDLAFRQAALVSHSYTAPNVTADLSSGSFAMSLSQDGTTVAFESEARDLIPGQIDGNGGSDVFLYRAASGVVTLISRTSSSPVTTGNAPSTGPLLDAAGVSAAFLSQATNLVAGQIDTNAAPDLFLRDLTLGTTALVSHAGASLTASDPSARFTMDPSLSLDGRFVGFSSDGSGLVAGMADDNRALDAFLYDRLSGSVQLLSRADGRPSTGNNSSRNVIFSADAGLVVFNSEASDLISGVVDTNGNQDVFALDRQSDTLSMISLRAPDSPGVTAGGPSGLQRGAISANGRFAAFWTYASNIVPGLIDTNQAPDLYLGDRMGRATSLASRSADSAFSTANAAVEESAVSANGRYVVFVSRATDVVTDQADSNGERDVFLFDRIAGTTTLVSHASDSPFRAANAPSSQPAISASGRYVVFSSLATDLVDGQIDGNDGSDVFLFDRISGAVTLVSRARSGVRTGNGPSSNPVMSADASRIAYQSDANDLIPRQDSNGSSDVYVFDRVRMKTFLISRASGSPVRAGNGRSQAPVISADGTSVAFLSDADNLVPRQIAGTEQPNAFLRRFSFSSGVTVLVSHKAGDPNAAANGRSDSLAIDATGKRVAFRSFAGNLVPGQTSRGGGQVMLYDAETKQVTLVSRAAGGGAGTVSDGPASTPSLSADGRRVAFTSFASNLVPGQVDPNGQEDVFLYDRIAGKVELVSRSMASPTQTPSGSGFTTSSGPVISADGNCVAFTSYGEDLVPGDLNGQADAFLYCRDGQP